MRRIKREDFWTDLALIEAQGFFDDCDKLAHEEFLALKREQRYRERRRVNAIKARRIHARFIRVISFDPWKATQHIRPDVFGDTHARIEVVKKLTNKKLRVMWVLWAMYHYWMFDVLTPGAKNYGNKYSKHRRLWYRHISEVHERVRQEKWDRKRERVRARRAKVKILKKKGLTSEEIIKRLKDYVAPVHVHEVIDNMEPVEELVVPVVLPTIQEYEWD